MAASFLLVFAQSAYCSLIFDLTSLHNKKRIILYCKHMSKTSSLIIIIIFNSVPIIGVAFYNWSVFEMFWLFWVETLDIGFFNCIRVLYSQAQVAGMSISPVRRRYNFLAALKYLLGRIVIFLFYSLFIIVFIGFVANSQGEEANILKTIAFLNPLFNLAIVLSVCSQSYYLIKNYFLNGAYQFSSPSQYPILFDGRQIVIHIAIVLGAVGSAFLFKDKSVAHYGAIWIIAVLCICKTIYDWYSHETAQPVAGT